MHAITTISLVPRPSGGGRGRGGRGGKGLGTTAYACAKIITPKLVIANYNYSNLSATLVCIIILSVKALEWG